MWQSSVFMQYVSSCGCWTQCVSSYHEDWFIRNCDIYSGGGGTGNLIEDHAWSSQTSVPTTRMPNDVTL